jgi:hypothetical protein
VLKGADADECVAIRLPRITTIGRLRAAARAADMNLRPAATVSNWTRMASVSGSFASQSIASARSTSMPAPRCSAVEKPMPLLCARSSTAAATAADWVTSPILPAATPTGATLAARPSAGTAMPPLPGPSTRIR